MAMHACARVHLCFLPASEARSGRALGPGYVLWKCSVAQSRSSSRLSQVLVSACLAASLEFLLDLVLASEDFRYYYRYTLAFACKTDDEFALVGAGALFHSIESAAKARSRGLFLVGARQRVSKCWHASRAPPRTAGIRTAPAPPRPTAAGTPASPSPPRYSNPDQTRPHPRSPIRGSWM